MKLNVKKLKKTSIPDYLYVFLDTSIIVKENFFLGTKLKSLYAYSKTGNIKLCISKVVYNEIIRVIKKETISALNVIKKNASSLDHKNRILKNIEEFEIFFSSWKIEKDKFINQLLDKFENTIRENSIEIIDFKVDSIETIFDDYFNEKPPFRADKSEFPDAFIIANYEKYCSDNSIEGLLISSDNDILNYKSDDIRIFNNIQNVLDIIIRRNEEKERIESISVIEEVFNKEKTQIASYILKNLEYLLLEEIDINRYYSSHFIDDINLKIRSIELEGFDILSIDIFDSIISIDGYAEIEISYSYLDEEDEGMGRNKSYKSYGEDIYFDAECIIDHNPKAGRNYASFGKVVNIELSDTILFDNI